jgi:DNA-binding XRE family transcriptional regulator
LQLVVVARAAGIVLNKYGPFTVLALKIARVFEKPAEEIFLLEDQD